MPTDEGDYGFREKEKLTFTVYPNESGTFTDSFFTDDGESYEYLNGNCAKLEFNVTSNENEVVVQIQNKGKMQIDYDIRLAKADKRKLVIKQ